ncbi:sigma-70 family RNA polymerase sigma factor [bacterium]|nr:sigma-70 family RNA polymerase sigma factor [bacterium]
MDTERKSDEELMAQYQNGDMNAFNLLYMRYEKRIYNYFLKRLTNPERSAELFQDTFLKLHQYRDRFDPKLSFRAWLFTIASNIAKSEFKRAEKTKNLFDNGEVDYDIIEDTHVENPGSSLESKELSDKIKESLKFLPESQREVIILSKYEELSYAQIAKITNSSVGAVKQKAHRGFTSLRKKLKGLFHQEEDGE